MYFGEPSHFFLFNPSHFEYFHTLILLALLSKDCIDGPKIEIIALKS